MRNPNGFGGITKMKGKRRNPWRVRVTDKIVDGKQTYINIGYYPSRKDAMKALSAYNNNPNIFEASTITFAEVYELWSARKYSTISESGKRVYMAAYKLCEPIKSMPARDIKAAHLQNVMDNCGKNPPTKEKLKLLMGQIFQYCMENDIVDKNYATFVRIEKDNDEKKLVRAPFTEDEIKTLWDNLERNPWIDTILIMIYTGLRIGELLSIESPKVYIADKYMIGGSKSEAGKDRIIPLHERIIPLVEKRLADGGNLLIIRLGKAVDYQYYLKNIWSDIMDEFKMSHLPHDCRHTFASRADTVGMNKICIKHIMGHKVSGVTDRVYTHKDISELVGEVNKLL